MPLSVSSFQHTVTDETERIVNAAFDRFPSFRSQSALSRLVPIHRDEAGFRADRPEWCFRAIPVRANDSARVIICLHFPLLATSPLLNREGTDMCQTYKILLSILYTAGVDPTCVFFTDSLPLPSEADTPPTSQTTTTVRQGFVDALLASGIPCVFFGDQSELDLQGSLLFGHPICLSMSPSARTSCAQALSSSTLTLEQLQQMADSAYQAFLDDCARVCVVDFPFCVFSSDCFICLQGGAATQALIRRYLEGDVTLTDEDWEAADKAYHGRCQVRPIHSCSVCYLLLF